ncbi:hypothetical protein SDC9_202583 [bioreactor metagenome]|uniref:Uncharacterized protein n=1 Tax=bioreactor metagenome TaxID=1076179 RepID=A0A645IU06_9ZZZZ
MESVAVQRSFFTVNPLIRKFFFQSVSVDLKGVCSYGKGWLFIEQRNDFLCLFSTKGFIIFMDDPDWYRVSNGQRLFLIAEGRKIKSLICLLTPEYVSEHTIDKTSGLRLEPSGNLNRFIHRCIGWNFV